MSAITVMEYADNSLHTISSPQKKTLYKLKLQPETSVAMARCKWLIKDADTNTEHRQLPRLAATSPGGHYDVFPLLPSLTTSDLRYLSSCQEPAAKKTNCKFNRETWQYKILHWYGNTMATNKTILKFKTNVLMDKPLTGI